METASPRRTQNRADMLYYSDPNVRKEIDAVLRENAIMFSNLGTGSSKTDVLNAKAQEKRNLKSVRHLDPAFIDSLLYEN